MQTRLKRSLRVTFLGMAVNILLAAIKLVTGIVGHSHALVADAVESFADVCSSLVVWRGLVVAAAPADEDHPYGHGKAESISAMMVAGMLVVAALWIAVKAIIEIASPQQSPEPYTLLVLVLVVVVKEVLFRIAWHEGNAVDSPAVKSDAWHHRSDALTSVAAGLGITVSVLAGPGYAWADDVAALFASGIILWNGLRLLRPAMDDLMDATPDPAIVEELGQIAERVAGPGSVEKCLVRRSGGQLLVDMHLEVDPDMPVVKAHRIAHDVKDAVRNERPAVLDVLVHLEPRRTSPQTETAHDAQSD